MAYQDLQIRRDKSFLTFGFADAEPVYWKTLSSNDGHVAYDIRTHIRRCDLGTDGIEIDHFLYIKRAQTSNNYLFRMIIAATETKGRYIHDAILTRNVPTNIPKKT